MVLTKCLLNWCYYPNEIAVSGCMLLLSYVGLFGHDIIKGLRQFLEYPGHFCNISVSVVGVHVNFLHARR